MSTSNGKELEILRKTEKIWTYKLKENKAVLYHRNRKQQSTIKGEYEEEDFVEIIPISHSPTSGEK